MNLQPTDLIGVKKLFETILEQFMFKIKDEIIVNGMLKDRDNNIVLKGKRSKQYNRCC